MRSRYPCWRPRRPQTKSGWHNPVSKWLRASDESPSARTSQLSCGSHDMALVPAIATRLPGRVKLSSTRYRSHLGCVCCCCCIREPISQRTLLSERPLIGDRNPVRFCILPGSHVPDDQKPGIVMVVSLHRAAPNIAQNVTPLSMPLSLALALAWDRWRRHHTSTACARRRRISKCRPSDPGASSRA